MEDKNKFMKTEIYKAWFNSLKDRKAVDRVKVRIRSAENGDFGDCRPVGEGMSEMRIDCAALAIGHTIPRMAGPFAGC